MNAISFADRRKREVGLAMAMPITVTMVDCGRCHGLLGSQICVNRLGNSHSVWPGGISIRVNRWRSNGVRASAAVVEEEKTETPYVPRLKSAYLERVVPVLYDEFKHTNLLQVPRVEKIVVNCGIGEAAQNAKALESAIRDLSLVTGQRPVKTRAKKSIAGFKLREGAPVGLAVTLRGNIMYSFLDRLINLGLPRTRDFQGVNPNSFDGHGNYNIGIREQTVFPEIKFESMDKPRGMDICISTSAKSDNEAQKLLSLMGMPFREGVTTVASVRKKRKSNYKGEKGGKGRKKK